jgi:tetratricopeptide (TPR) repeat protein
MPVSKPTSPVPRRALETVVAALGADRAGVALVGNEGVGKTTLAAMAAQQLDRGEPLWVVGTFAQSSVPFGAFGRLLDFDEAGKPSALIRSAADSILSQAHSRPIIVDNARLLDPLSASLVYHLAQAGTSPLIVTVRSVLRIPQVVGALWNDGLLERVDILPFDAEETAAVVATAAGGGDRATAAGGGDRATAAGGGDRATAARRDPATLYRRSAGNGLHLRMLMSTGGNDETLSGAIDRYLGELSPAVRHLLGHLCVFEPLSRSDLVTLTGEAVLEQALELGVAQVYSMSESEAVYSGHPLFLERMAAILDRSEIQRLRTAVAAQLAATPSSTPADRLGRTLIALQGDGPVDADAVVAAANEALQLGDIALAERLARGALERGEHFNARLTLSTALGWQGRGREADTVLAAVDPAELSEEQMMAWALPRAANQFWMLSEPERATTFLQNVRRKVGHRSSHITLDALSATFSMNAGNVRRAVEVADEVLSKPDAPAMAVAWAASAAALSSARMGRFEAVSPAVSRALGSEYPGLLRFTLGLAETTTLLMEAKVDEAYTVAKGFTDFAELAQPGRAIGEVLLAQVLLAKGDADAAADLVRPAADTLARSGYSWGPLALMYLTTALGYRGEIAESAKALARAQSRHGTKSAMFAPELGIARAWRLATIGDRPAAITAARDAARTAKRSGQLAVAVRAWHEAARLGDRRAADAMAQVADAVVCEYTDLAIAHARALAAGDATALTAAAERLAEAGFAGAAADARRQAEDYPPR